MVGEEEAEDAETVSSQSSASAESSQAKTPESPRPQVQHMLISACLVIDTTRHQNTSVAVASNRKGQMYLISLSSAGL